MRFAARLSSAGNDRAAEFEPPIRRRKHARAPQAQTNHVDRSAVLRLEKGDQRQPIERSNCEGGISESQPPGEGDAVRPTRRHVPKRSSNAPVAQRRHPSGSVHGSVARQRAHAGDAHPPELRPERDSRNKSNRPEPVLESGTRACLARSFPSHRPEAGDEARARAPKRARTWAGDRGFGSIARRRKARNAAALEAEAPSGERKRPRHVRTCPLRHRLSLAPREAPVWRPPVPPGDAERNAIDRAKKKTARLSLRRGEL